MSMLGKIASIGTNMMTSITTVSAGPALPNANQTALRETAQKLEAEFLTEMLGHAGLGDARESFGGGVGEEQFASFLKREQATAMAQKGGIGLAETIFRALQRTANA
jgi:Rod binding domain-containing protein